jgi:hypothetical protein
VTRTRRPATAPSRSEAETQAAAQAETQAAAQAETQAAAQAETQATAQAETPAGTQAVTMLIWRVPRQRLPLVLWRIARDRGNLRRRPGVCFAKLLGTGSGRRFGPGRADLTRWAALVVHDGHIDIEAALTGWSALATATLRLELTPLAARGRWSGQQPFAACTKDADQTDARMQDHGPGPVLALTRARLRPTRAAAFWRAVGSPARAASQAAGLLATFGIGEAPICWQGTVSVWRSADDLVEFAYRHRDHRRVIELTRNRWRWYAEDMFARFAVADIRGDRDVIGWTEIQR